MRTLELIVHVEDLDQELLIAELADLDFDSFTCEDHALRAYIPAARFDDVRREHIERWLAGRGYAGRLEEHVHDPQNWNERWEQTIRPVAVGPFLVKPTWAEVPPEHAGRTVLEIDPKMSFGTGYHASTRLALLTLPERVQGGERVLDVGTGTGILAVAALKLGAARAVACDTDPWAQQNAVENFYLNGVADRVAFRAGSLEAVPETGFDLVLANIDRTTLLELLPALAERTAPGGHLVLSGLLVADRDALGAAAEAAGFRRADEAVEGEWIALTLSRR